MDRLLFSLKTCQKSATKFLKIGCTHVPTSWGHVQKSGTKFLKIFFTHVPTSWGHVKKSGTKFLKIFFTHVPTSWRHVKNICPSSAKSICYFSVCHWVVSQGSGCSGHSAYLSISQHTGRTREGRGSMANRKISYTLRRGRAYMFHQIPENMLHPCTH